MIWYFSASGNSRFIAETAAESLQDSCLCLNEKSGFPGNLLGYTFYSCMSCFCMADS